MKVLKTIFATLLLIAFMGSCKAVVKGAAKYWTKQQVEEFTVNCEKNARTLLSAEKAKTYCNCAVHKVAKAYPDYESIKKTTLREVLKVAKSCEDKVD